jgi:hypothetical protein
MKNFSKLFLVSLLSGATTLGAYKLLFDSNGYFSKNRNSVVTLAPNNYGKTVGLSSEAVDFTEAADKSVHTVVHVKNVSYTSISKSNYGVFLRILEEPNNRTNRNWFWSYNIRRRIHRYQ